ncbi:MAG: T9SS type A sorting domain-containing protein [Bacteroidales bacterium]|nr:T9SS type A sorting domain-containing protein [Bacteroidales bacterium]
MKLILLSLLITVCVFYTYSQNYRQFPTSEDKPLWVLKTTYPHIEDNDEVHCSFYGLIGDTTINSVVYEKIYSLNDTIVSINNIEYYLGCIREETKKIYTIKANSTYKKLVFDFSKTINDTILFDSAFIIPPPINLTNIDTLNLNGENYLRYWTSCGDKWIEGIGNTEWDIFGICPELPDNGSYTRLNSFKLNNTMIYGTDCKCENYIAASINKYEQNELIEIFPNPANNYVTFKFNNSIKNDNYKIIIFNIIGKVVFEDLLLNNSNTIKLDNINSGLYIIEFILDNSIYSSKLIVDKY